MNTTGSLSVKNRIGHEHRGLKTPDGYGICSLCQARENTDDYNRCIAEGYYMFSNPLVGIEEKSKIFISVDKDGSRWVDWCEPSVAPTKIDELLDGFVFEKIEQ
jgi:hypothetical protein